MIWLVVEPYPSEKWWSSSVGMMTIHILWKKMFQSTNQWSSLDWLKPIMIMIIMAKKTSQKITDIHDHDNILSITNHLFSEWSDRFKDPIIGNGLVLRENLNRKPMGFFTHQIFRAFRFINCPIIQFYDHWECWIAWKILVSWDDYCIYYGKNVPKHQPVTTIGLAETLWP